VHATFTAHGDRLPGYLPSFPSADIGCIHSLTIRQGRTLRHLARCGPSPCTRLSRAPTTMATLTADRGVGGFQMCFHTVTSALLHIPDQLSHVPIDGLKRSRVGGGYRTTSPRLSRLPSGHGVDQVRPCHPVAAHDRLPRRVELTAANSTHTRCPIRQGLETGDHFPVG
jgi:hypothetical protein